VCALAAWAGACGSGSDSATNPSGSGAAVIQGTVNGGSSAAPGTVGSLSDAGARVRISVVGTSLSTMADSTGTFVLAGVPLGTVTLRFEGPGIDARLQIAGLLAGQVLTIAVHADGNQATLISPGNAPAAAPSPSPTASPGDQEVEFQGTLEAINPPTLKVAGRTVITNGSTVIELDDRRGSLADLKVGMKVEVEGNQQPDGRVLARKIEAENEDEDEVEAEFTGTIESITPPTLRVSSQTVVTDARTVIELHDKQGHLSDLKVGMKAEVKGRRQADGRVLAERIKTEDEDEHEDD
jgi:hypothetical protein